MNQDNLFMIQLEPSLPDLMRFLAHQGLNNPADEDFGYGTHVWLKALFGPYAPKPFRLFQADRRNRPIRLLAYTAAPPSSLIEHAATFAEPGVLAVGDPTRSLTSKRLPTSAAWVAGRRLGFEVLACPVVRHAGTGGEQDVFLHRLNRAAADEAVSRPGAYTDWLAQQVAGAATIERAELTGFSLGHHLRRSRPVGADRARRAHSLRRPRALLAGEFRVEDPDRFAALLARGIGRHRSFGYGMLLLRSPA